MSRGVQARDTVALFNLTCSLYPSAGTAVTEGHRWGSHAVDIDFLLVLGVNSRSSEVVSGETLLQAFLLCPHTALPRARAETQAERERESFSLYLKGHSPMGSGPHPYDLI